MHNNRVADAKICRHRLHYSTNADVKFTKPPTAKFPFADGSNWYVLCLSFVPKGGRLRIFLSKKGALMSLFFRKMGGAYKMIVKKRLGGAYRDMGAY